MQKNPIGIIGTRVYVTNRIASNFLLESLVFIKEVTEDIVKREKTELMGWNYTEIKNIMSIARKALKSSKKRILHERKNKNESCYYDVSRDR